MHRQTSPAEIAAPLLYSFLLLLGLCAIAAPVQAQTFEKVYDFPSSPNGFRCPDGGLAEAPDGTLYGVTEGHHPRLSRGFPERDTGTLYGFTPSTLSTSIAHEFILPTAGENSYVGGEFPKYTPAVDPEGSVFGTAQGGTHGTGVIWRNGAGGYAVLHMFGPLEGGDLINSDGIDPVGGLLLASDGNLYGVTLYGGKNVVDRFYGGGVAFSITPKGSFKVIHSFGEPGDAYFPETGLTEGPDGGLYGVGAGGVFKLVRDQRAVSGWLEAPLFTFSSAQIGDRPESRPLVTVNGNVFGTFFNGSYGNNGSLWELTPRGNFRTLATFKSMRYGRPCGAVIEGPDGNLWFTAPGYEHRSSGAVYEFSKTGKLLWEHDFSYLDGMTALGDLLLASDGALYGTTVQGGINGKGTIFRIMMR